MGQYLLDTGAEIHARAYPNGHTPLHSACLWKHEEIAKLLIDAGASMEMFVLNPVCSWTPVHLAAHCGLLSILKYMRSRGVNWNLLSERKAPPLQYAAHQGHIAVVQYLLSEEIAEIGYKDGSGYTALQYATSNNRIGVVKLLITRGPDLGTSNGPWSQLHVAASVGLVEVGRIFLNEGVDVESRQFQGATALHLAAENGHVGFLQLLLKRGADTKAVMKTAETALLMATLTGQVEAISLLLDSRADVDPATNPELSSFRAAVAIGHAPIIKLLISRGSNVKALNPAS